MLEEKNAPDASPVEAALRGLEGDVYHAIHDYGIATKDGSIQVAHLLVSRHGVFVIEPLVHGGWIFGGQTHRYWTRVGSDDATYTFANPILQGRCHISVLGDRLGVGASLFHSVIAFGDDAEFRTDLPDYVLCGGLADYIRTKTDILLNDEEVRWLVERLKCPAQTSDEQCPAALRTRFAPAAITATVVADEVHKAQPDCHLRHPWPVWRRMDKLRPSRPPPPRHHHKVALAAGVLLSVLLLYSVAEHLAVGGASVTRLQAVE